MPGRCHICHELATYHPKSIKWLYEPALRKGVTTKFISKVVTDVCKLCVYDYDHCDTYIHYHTLCNYVILYTQHISCFTKMLSSYHEATPTNYFIRHILFFTHKIYIGNLCCMIVWCMGVILWWVMSVHLLCMYVCMLAIEKQSWVSCENAMKSLWMNCSSNIVDSHYNNLLGPSENTVDLLYIFCI